MLRTLVRQRAGRVLLHCLERALLPGLARHYAWRKRRIAGWVAQERARGTRQLLLLGAGFDALGAHWVAADDAAVALELDQPACVARKRLALACCGLARSRHHLRGVDLADADATLAPALDLLDPSRATVVVAEGLLMYLAPAAVTALLHALQAWSHVPLCVIGSAMRRSDDDRVGFLRQSRAVGLWLRASGEPFRWGIADGELATTLAGWNLVDASISDPADPADPDPAPGEWLFHATLAPVAASAGLASPVRESVPTSAD